MTTPPFSWLAAHHPRIYFILAGGVGDWFEILRACPRLAVAKTSRSTASNIYDLTAQRAREAFADIPDEVRIVEEYETISIYFIKHDVTMKIHKANEAGYIHPPNTDRSYRAYYQTGLFGNSPDDRGVVLNAIYQLNAPMTALASISVTCQRGDEIVYRHDIEPPQAGDRFSVVLPQTPPVTDDGDVGYATGSA